VAATCKIGRYFPRGHGPLPNITVEVLAEHDDIIAINKPGCVHCWEYGWYRAGYPPMATTLQYFYPGYSAAHRIDGTTSGVLMFGTNGRGGGRGRLSKMWPTKALRKRYLAYVPKPPEWLNQEVTIKVDGKECTTGLKYLGRGWVLAELLDGGRNHQIRRAMKHIGTPIAGDILYGGSPDFARPMLHAWKVSIEGWGQVAAKVPDDMPPCNVDYSPAIMTYEVAPLNEDEQMIWHEHCTARRKGHAAWAWKGPAATPTIHHSPR